MRDLRRLMVQARHKQRSEGKLVRTSQNRVGSVQVRQDKVQVRQMPRFSQSITIDPGPRFNDAPRLTASASSLPSSRPTTGPSSIPPQRRHSTQCQHTARFGTRMDDSLFLPDFWDTGGEGHSRNADPPLSSYRRINVNAISRELHVNQVPVARWSNPNSFSSIAINRNPAPLLPPGASLLPLRLPRLSDISSQICSLAYIRPIQLPQHFSLSSRRQFRGMPGRLLGCPSLRHSSAKPPHEAVWQEVQRLVVKHTRKKLKFKGLHKGGKILGLNADMEAAPLLGFAHAFVDTVDLDEVRSVVVADPVLVLLYVLRLCYSHYNRGIPNLSHLSAEDRRRISDLKYAKTVAEVEAFKTWISTLPDPDGVLKRTIFYSVAVFAQLMMLGWWGHKTMHNWLLPGFIQCLSKIPLEQWNTMESTTNLGEAQHAWNYAQTGTSMGAIESFKKYEELDIRRAEEIEVRKATAISRNSHNEVSQRYANRTARQSRGSEKARRARAADSNVAALQTELSEMKEELTAARGDNDAEQSVETTRRVRDLEASVVDVEGKLKLAKAEAKSNSSGRVRAPKASAGATASNSTTEPTQGAPTALLTPASCDGV
ncbi:hypothetical protein C8R44DRAFT_733910 [Mycena epipterygia]|nr:hypothetical protein C8R44DRAFT_733910 [Mycena epipterygia]